MIIYQSNIYLGQEDISALKSEDKIVLERYQAVARTLVSGPFRLTRQKAADFLGRSKRQLQRWVKRFKEEGIPGLRNRSKRPKSSPNRTPKEIEDLVVNVRRKTGFGPRDLGVLINESFTRREKKFHLWPSTAYNILVRRGEIERERRKKEALKTFEWSHPNRLIQADLTSFNGIAILTMEDDHSRKGWSIALRNQKDKTVIRGMKKLIKKKYDNLLTDNGSQFSRKNSEMRKYCEEFLNEKHIWTSIHHPRTMGKLSAFQKALKRFLRFHIPDSTKISEINKYIKIFVKWYNNGKYHSAIETFPEERYSGQRSEDWFESIVEDLKMEDLLMV